MTRYGTPRKAKTKALNELTPPRKGQTTPLLCKFDNLSIYSPARQSGGRSPINGGSDKENYRDEENYYSKKQKSSTRNKSSAKKRLPFGECNNQIINFMDNENAPPELFSSKTRSSPRLSAAAPLYNTQNSSPQKRTRDAYAFNLDSDSDDANYRYKGSPPKRRSLPAPAKLEQKKIERRRSTKPINIKNDKENDNDDFKNKIETKTPLKVSLKRTQSITPQKRKPSIPMKNLGGGLEDEYQSESDDNNYEPSFGLEEEFNEEDYNNNISDTTSEDDDYDTIVSKEKKTPKASRGKICEVETFVEEPPTSKMRILIEPISKLDLECLKETATRRAGLRTKRETNPLMKIYEAFHTSALPDVLLKREEQCKEIESFIKQAIGPKSSVHNRSIYISGVPGTGKTACVTKVIQKLQKKSKTKFNHVYVNGLELVKPQHVFSEIYSALFPSNRSIAPKTAREKLSKIFNVHDKNRDFILLVVDELDMLCTKSQDVVYDIFDWASTKEAKLVVIGIANTLDLPERVLKQRVSSRLGYNRITFQPYNFKEIEEILNYRVKQSKISSNKEVFGLVSRKVAAVSGDLRKALEFIRRAIEIAVEQDAKELTNKHIQAAIKEGLQSLPLMFTKSLSFHQECLLRSIIQEVRATSLEELDFFSVYEGYRRNCVAQAVEPMEMCPATGLLSSLQTMGYIDVKSYGLVTRRIQLKMSMDEIDSLLRQAHLTGEN